MSIAHLPPTAEPAEVAGLLESDGAAIVDHVASRQQIDAVLTELAPHLDATALGPDGFSGRRTRRTGGLIARSPTVRELLQHPLVLDCVGEVLSHATNFQIHLTQMIAIGAGEKAQSIHRDQWAFDFFPFPRGYEVQCNTLWAMTDFTEENGATRVVLGSHRAEDRRSYAEEESQLASKAVTRASGRPRARSSSTTIHPRAPPSRSPRMRSGS
ncbi:MAG: phytanoyl-CoA dioxygenase family protein [Myxococcota bacterium]